MQHGPWKWTDGSVAGYIDWGLPLRYESDVGVLKPTCMSALKKYHRGSKKDALLFNNPSINIHAPIKDIPECNTISSPKHDNNNNGLLANNPGSYVNGLFGNRLSNNIIGLQQSNPSSNINGLLDNNPDSSINGLPGRNPSSKINGMLGSNLDNSFNSLNGNKRNNISDTNINGAMNGVISNDPGIDTDGLLATDQRGGIHSKMTDIFPRSILTNTSTASFIDSRFIDDDPNGELMCAVVELLPGQSVLTVTNCSTNYQSRVVCMSSNRQIENITHVLSKQRHYRTNYVGFSISDDQASAELLSSNQNCPEGFFLLFDHSCTKLIPHKEGIPDYARTCHIELLDHIKGLIFNYEGNYTDKMCSDEEEKNMLNKLDAICKTQNASILHYGDVFPMIQILGEIFSMQYVALHGMVHPRHVGICVNHTKCLKYPVTSFSNDRIIDPVDFSLPHFVLCSKPYISAVSRDLPKEFQTYSCNGADLIAAALVCDGKADCLDGRDERDCSYVCTGTLCFSKCPFPSCTCHNMYYQCEDGGCVPFDKFCDNVYDCPHGDDELGCDIEVKDNLSKHTIRVVTNVKSCTGHEGLLPCRNDLECYNVDEICQYDISPTGQLSLCADGTHLAGETVCKHIVCPQKYKCLLSYCIPLHKVCNSVIDCPNGDDEMSCDNITCPGQVRCSGSKQCVIHQELCDGNAHCPWKDDELFCQECPLQCHCRGNMIECYSIDDHQSFAGVNITTTPAALVLHSSTALYFHFLKNFRSHMNNVYYLSIRGGNSSALDYLPLGLRWLSITHHQITHLPNISTSHLTRLNLSHNIIRTIPTGVFAQLQQLKMLILTANRISVVKAHFFSDLIHLKFLYVDENPIIDIDSGIFLQNSQLFYIRSDWYMVCCTAFTVKDCKPQGAFVSTCSSLFSGIPEKFLITSQGLTATVTNSFSLIYRLFYYKAITAHKALMISLSGADLLMGLYLGLLSGVDLHTDGSFYLIVTQWTNNNICIAASLLNFVSSHVSLMILMILSFSQWRTISKVGGLRNVRKQVIVGSVISWVFILSMGVAHVIYSYLHGLTLRNNMCIIMATSNIRNISSFEFSFLWVMITADVCFLVLLTVSMFGILSVISASSQTVNAFSATSTRKFVMMRTCRRVALLLFCNALCWLPLLIICILMLSGVSFHENVLIWITVLLIPVSATTDPLLYNIGLCRMLYNIGLCRGSKVKN